MWWGGRGSFFCLFFSASVRSGVYKLKCNTCKAWLGTIAVSVIWAKIGSNLLVIKIYLCMLGDSIELFHWSLSGFGQLSRKAAAQVARWVSSKKKKKKNHLFLLYSDWIINLKWKSVFVKSIWSVCGDYKNSLTTAEEVWGGVNFTEWMQLWEALNRPTNHFSEVWWV